MFGKALNANIRIRQNLQVGGALGVLSLFEIVLCYFEGAQLACLVEITDLLEGIHGDGKIRE